MNTACTAGALSALAGAVSAAGAGGPAPALAVACATLLLAAALVTGLATPVFVAVLLLVAIYVVPDGDRVMPSPIYGGVMLLIAELAFWSLDERRPARVEPGTGMPRLRGILAVVAIGVAASALVLLAAEVDTTRSPEGTAAGVAAVLACVAVLTALARSHRAPEATESSG